MKKLCIQLVKAEDENEVIALLKKFGYWNNSEDWQYLGGMENNFSAVGNQQREPEAALVEKLINSVDAVLMAEASIRGESPKCISEAVELFFNVPNGRLSRISASQRTELSKKIALVATGTRSNPCYEIIDYGEGQTPNKMPDTFLSIIKESNKLRVPFVQGKFNMGGTGVLQFCGKNNLQLIISKRHPEIIDNDDSREKWGFTLIRREDPSESIRSSVYRYLAPKGKILSFYSDSLPIFPGKNPSEPYGNDFTYGSFIKLYNYQITKLKSIINFDLYYRISLLLPGLALPIRFYERRTPLYKAKSYESTLAGLSVRLDEDKNKNLEPNFPSSEPFTVFGQEMNAAIYAFKLGKDESYKKNEGIIFTINGQTHGFLDKKFFERKSVGMAYLKKSILIIIDCSYIDGRMREDLFMNSRDRLRGGEFKREIEKKIEYIVHHHPGLRALKEKRRLESIKNKLKDDKSLSEVLEKIINKSPVLANLFIEGSRINNPFNLSNTQYQEKFEGKEFPTFFLLKKQTDFDNPKKCPLNSKFRIQFRTDVNNDYFNRDKYPGEFFLELNEETADYSLNLWNGYANLSVKLPEWVNVKEQLKYDWKIFDEIVDDKFKGSFFVEVEEERNKNSSGNNKAKKPSGTNKGNDTTNKSKLALPTISEISKEEWDQHEMNSESALKAIDDGEGAYDFYLNIDNKYLLAEIKASKENIDIICGKYKYSMVLIGIALLNADKNKTTSDENEDKETIYNTIEKITTAISPVILPIINELSSIGND